jgi:Zn-dependent protease with chaperone function/DNA-binding cell septation regulator SpoVG
MPLPPTVLQDPLWAHLDKNWKPIPKRPGYALMSGIVLAMVLLMPLLYLASLTGAGYVAYWFWTNPPSTIGSFLRVLIFLSALTLVLFMIKPLFAPRDSGGRPVKLKEFEELRLHSFVQNVCGVIGAPPPKEIHLDCDVNASAGFRHGLLSIFVPGDVVLTIGMPLVAGLTKRQFAGVLAHEFGHFAQGAGMRISFIARWIANWFVSVATQFDLVDVIMIVALRSGSILTPIALFMLVCSIVVRLLFYAIAFLCILPISAMLRHMEFDADHYEVQFGGFRAFSSTMDMLDRLNAATWRALEEARRAYNRENTLPDNLPVLIADQARRMTPEECARLKTESKKARTGFLATHPSRSAREKAADGSDEGLYKDDGPASELFGDFENACRKASRSLFYSLLGPDARLAKLKSMGDLVVTGHGHEKKQQAIARYFGFDIASWRPVFPRLTSIPDIDDPKVLLAKLKSTHQQLRAAAPDATKAIESLRNADDEKLRWEQARCVIDAGFRADFKGLSLPSAPRAGVSRKIDMLTEQYALAADTADAAGDLAAARLSCALALLGARGVINLIPTTSQDRARADELLQAMQTLKLMMPPAREIRTLSGQAGAVIGCIKNKAQDEQAKKILRPLSDAIRDRLDDARRIGGGTPDPFRENGMAENLSFTIVGASPAWREMAEIFAAGALFVSNYPDSIRRCTAELVGIAERVERSIAERAKAATKTDAGASTRAKLPERV